jgi:hypothetical protein
MGLSCFLPITVEQNYSIFTGVYVAENYIGRVLNQLKRVGKTNPF